jgi:hypothetical protein
MIMIGNKLLVVKDVKKSWRPVKISWIGVLWWWCVEAVVGKQVIAVDAKCLWNLSQC